ncbi:DNA polymerase III subunit delta [Candidatus Riflebacteria bacterium]
MALKLEHLYEKIEGLKFSKALCLAGKEEFLKKLFIAEVIAEFKKIHPDGIIYRLNPKNISVRPINSYLQDLFGSANFRFFLIENLGAMSGNLRKELFRLAQNLDLNRNLVFFTCQKSGIEKELQSNLKGKIDIVLVWPLFAHQIPDWVQKRIKVLKKNCSLPLCQEIAENCDNQLELIYSTIKKICSYLGEQENVTTEVVQLLCKKSGKRELFHIIPCLGNKDGAAAFSFSQQLLAQKGIKPITLFYLVANFFKELCLIKSFLEDFADTCYPMMQMARSFASIKQKSDYKSNVMRKNIVGDLKQFLAGLDQPPIILLKKYKVYQLLEYTGYAEGYKLNELESILMLLKNFDIQLKYHPTASENIFFHLLAQIFSSISATK